MTFYVNSPNEVAVASALQAWVMYVLDLPETMVIAGNDNGVAAPIGTYIVLTHMGRTPLSTPWLTYGDTGVPSTENEVTNLSLEYQYQLDVYGPNASDLVMILHVMFRSDATSQWLSDYGEANDLTVDAFFPDNPSHVPIVNEENQYEERWVLRVRLNVIQAISSPVNFMNSATVKPLINVSTLPR